MSLLSRLLSLVGLALLPVLGALVWGALDAGRAREMAERDDALRLARLVAADHQRLADGARQLLTALGNLRAVRVLDQEECQSFFQRIMADFPRYVLLATATLDGQVVCSAQPGAYGNNIRDREYFQRAVAEKGFVVGNFVLGRASGEGSFHFAQPFYDNQGAMAGVVHASVGLDWLSEQIGRVSLPPNAILSVIDRGGVVLAARPGRMQSVGKPLQGPIRAFLDRPAEGVEEATGADGVHRTYAYIPASASGTHTVIFGFDHAAVLAEASKVQRQGALVLLGSTLFAFCLTILGARRLVRRPVDRLLEAAERWRAGDTSARLRIGGGRSEFARLAAAFNAMADATEARELSLRDSESEFRAIFETAAVGVAQLDLRHFRVERVNRRLCEILGRGEEELVGCPLAEHVHPEDTNAYLARLSTLMATGQSTSEHRIIRGGGGVRWIRVFASVSEWTDGRPSRAVAMLQDVTEQRLGEEANARLAAIVTSAADAIISMSGQDGRIETWNKGAESLFGYSDAEAVGATIDLIVPPEDKEGALFRRALSGERIRDHEAIRMAKDGERIPVATTTTRMLAADGRTIGISVILRDLRERRAADQHQRLLMREIDHRAKNVMAVVRSLVQLSPKDDPVAFGRAIEGRISAMARAHSLLARDRWEGASLRDLVEEELGGRENGPNAASQAELEGPSVILRPDAVQPLSMVLHELVTNSMKYGALSSQDGRVYLRWQLEAEPGEAGTSLVIVWTERGGPPIPEPPRRKGFGSRLIEISVRHQLRGTVSLDWECAGLRAKIRVGSGCIAAPGPQAGPSPAPPPPAAPEPAASPSAAPPSQGVLQGLRILLAEDEMLVAIEAAESLAAAGCQVLGPAAALEEGIALADRAGPIDAAVLDVNLGGQQVVPLADMLVARGVPILFTTGYGEAPAGHHGAAVLTKPIRTADLVAALQRLVGSGPVA
jgi:PAS domain S-box-containing protein